MLTIVYITINCWSCDKRGAKSDTIYKHDVMITSYDIKRSKKKRKEKKRNEKGREGKVENKFLKKKFVSQ